MNQSELIQRANNVLPDGGLGNFDPKLIIRESNGSRIWDEDGNEYIDYLIGSGPLILGHGNPEVLEVVQYQLGKGTTFFANNLHAIELAEEICRAVPCAEQVRYVTSGSEADMYAMRLARAYTGRDKIVKFEGGYHGMSAEAQMSLAPETLMNFPVAVPDSAGIPDAVRDQVLIAPFNDIEFVRSLINEYSGMIGGIIVEPVQRIIPPSPRFLEELREECTKNNIVLIFDEIVTGFRLAYGGAQELYGVTPDICTLGKIIGGGFPLAVIAGNTDIMAHFDKNQVGADRFLMQNGTLSGNPIAAVAGLKTLEILRRPGSYKQLRTSGQKLMKAINIHLNNAGHAHQIVGQPELFDVLFTESPINNYRDFVACNNHKKISFNSSLKLHGILKSPTKLYLSLALSDDDIGKTIDAISHAAISIGNE